MVNENGTLSSEGERLIGIGFEIGPPRLHGLDAVAHQFATRLQLLWTYVRQIGSAAQSTSFANIAGVLALVNEIAESAKGRDKEEAIATFRFIFDLEAMDDKRQRRTHSFTLLVFEERHLRAIRERKTYHHAALRILHETAVQQLVNAYEQLLAALLRGHIAANTSEAARDQSITYQQLLEFGSLEEAKRHVIETQVTDFIRSKDTSEQFRYFRENVKVDVSASFPDIRLYRELVLRRHAIVHAGGVATPAYLKKLKSIGGVALPSEGAELDLTAEYVKVAWEVVYALGIVTFHLLAQTLARREQDEDAEDRADNWLNTAAVWAITERRYAAARRILSYAHSRKLAKDSCQLMVLVNLAQTYKWQGDDQKCRQLLKERDWDATNSAFRLCVAVLREEDVEALMVQAVKDGQLSLDSIYEWPIFQAVRRKDEFSESLKNVFGTAADRQAEPFPATMLDITGDMRLEKILKYLNDAARKPSSRVERRDQPPNADDVDDTTVH